MKTWGIISIAIGVFLVAVAIGLFQSIMSAKDDTDLLFYIFGIIFSGFGGLGFILGGIEDYNKACKDEKGDSKND